MQHINHWPDLTELSLPETVARDLFGQLLEPFDSEQTEKEFWNETSSTLIILDHSDSIDNLKGNDTWNQIEFALTYPEYTVPLKNGYQLLVAIVNDSGSGIYLAIPPELSHIISGEVITHE